MDVDTFAEAGNGNASAPGNVACTLPRPSFNGNTVGVCADFGLQSMAWPWALKYGLGGYALYVWAVGVLASGQSATMVCTYAGQIIMGGCLELKILPWVRVLVTRSIALGPAVLVAVGTYNNQQLYSDINNYLNILQSVQLPFAMLQVLCLRNGTGN